LAKFSCWPSKARKVTITKHEKVTMHFFLCPHIDKALPQKKMEAKMQDDEQLLLFWYVNKSSSLKDATPTILLPLTHLDWIIHQ
jgi:hypothetical protein